MNKNRLYTPMLPLPSTIAFVITARCNLHCKMCFQYGERAQKLGIKGNALLGNPKELTLEELKIIIGKINKYYPFDKKPNFFITGGEPFERRDMVDIIQYAASQGNRVIVNTSFSLIDEGTAEKLIEIENFAPLVSIDGPERIHDKIRGVNGTYKRAMKNVRFFSGRGKRVEVCTTITKYNVDYLVELYKELKGLKVYWYLKHVAWMPEKYVELQRKLSKRYFNVDFIVYLPEKVAVPANKIKVLEAQIDKIRKLKKEYGIGFEEAARPAGTSLFEHHCTFNCKQKNKICCGPEVNILPNGDVSFCNCGAYGWVPIYANVLHDELPEILTKKKPLEEVYNRLLKKGEVFPVCVKCCYLVNEDQLGIFEKFDRTLGRIGIFLNNNFPKIYRVLKTLKGDNHR